ncbi:MAG: SGNH/GDSL hydrolase family protein [Alphaproteobacteria bacterium]|nr:SGNH/GDSL hydrolase family protein [Alphaproteobacteria bacterium]
MRKTLLRATTVLLGLLLGLLVAAGAGEAWVRGKQWDEQMVANALYYQSVLVGLHRVEDDAVLHYSLKPDQDQEFGGVRVRTGPRGLRAPEHALQPPADTLRVLLAGASTVFGTGVGDEQTLPARLQAHLGPGAEVWNLGVSGYVELQMLRLARRHLAELPDVDLVVIVLTNRGRRPVLQSEPVVRESIDRYLALDPGYVPENLPAFIGGDPAPGWHRALLRGSAGWRYWTAWQATRHDAEPEKRQALDALLAEQALLRDEAAAAGVPVVYLTWPGHGQPCAGCWRGDVHLDWSTRPLPAGWTDLHPPAEILDGHAANLAAELAEAGVLSR